LRDGDIPRVVEACSDERTQHWLGRMPAPYTEADAHAWYAENTEKQATGVGAAWAVVDPDSDVMLAAINVFDVDEVDCEIGFCAHPDARGRGVTRAAMRLVTDWAFTELGVQRVRAVAALENTASRHVIEAAGFRLGGQERLGTMLRTGPTDAARYDVLASEWAELTSAR